MKYSKQQIMLTFSYMSYLGYALTGSDQHNCTKILTKFEQALTEWEPVKDQWQVVWGPAVFALPTTTFDDSLMFVVQNIENPNQYVIAIRGTNPISIPNWVIWNFEAKEMASWPWGQPGELKPKIAESTQFGLMVLQALRPPEGLPSEGLSLVEFMIQETKIRPNAQFCVTGHSLGASLAPALSLYLENIKGCPCLLPDTIEISTVTFAGATSGDADFAEFFDQCIGDRCDRVVNTLDIVPYAWDSETLRKLRLLYFPCLYPGPPMFYLLTKMQFEAKGKNYRQIQPNPTILQGQYQFCAIPYIGQAIYQHIMGYPNLLQLGDVLPVKQLFSPFKVFRAVCPFI